YCFFFSSRRRHTRSDRDWSSDVCSSDLFVPVFLVSIGLLLDPGVMFTGHTLGLAALLVTAALGGKAIACWLAGPLLKFNRLETVAMYVLTIPQAAATLGATLSGFEIGRFRT